MADCKRKTVNLVDESKVTPNTYIGGSGETGDSTSSNLTDYIDVNTSPFAISGVITGSIRSANNRALCFYDSDKNFISSAIYSPNVMTSPALISDIPQNAKYVRFAFDKAFENGIMLNLGSTALPYEPYWQHSLRKLTTATEAVENPLYSDGTAITSYTIKGNTAQNGTPTPDNPIMPQGCGDRTENLWDNSSTISKEQTSLYYKATFATPLPAGTYTFSAKVIAEEGVTACRLSFRNSDMAGINAGNISVSPERTSTTVTLNEPCYAIYMYGSNNTSTYAAVTYQDIMLNTGSTALPYEPYGYKIPISSGGVTTNIYLGNTQTTRQIKKLVLNGSTDGFWERAATRAGCFVLRGTGTGVTEKAMYCTHATYVSTASQLTSNNTCYMGADFNIWLDLFDGQTTEEQFKAYLQQQYAAGTPVTVWYVPATPEIGIVNEPLMKIGDYTDTVSNATTILTTEGANSITVDTTVQPSEFTATWSGWHNASVKAYTGERVVRYVDFTNNVKTIVGDPNTHPVYKAINRCNVADDGTITAYYGDNSYTEDGSNGQVMVYIPKFYYKVTPDQNGGLDGANIRKCTWEISDRPEQGFKLHPAFYDVNNNEIDYFLCGAFDAVGQRGTSYDTSFNASSDKLASVAGSTYKPVNNLTRSTARTMATNRGAGWYLVGVKQMMAIQMLMAVEYGFNSQIAIGQGVVSTSIAAYAGQTTGNITSGTQDNKTTPVNWRGIENLWGNIYEWVDGLNFYGKAPYFCDSYAFADSTSTGYTQVSFSLPSSNYITALGYDSTNDWILLPSESSSTANPDGPIGDYIASSQYSQWCVTIIGGGNGHNSDAGVFDWCCYFGNAAAYEYISARPMFIPVAI